MGGTDLGSVEEGKGTNNKGRALATARVGLYEVGGWVGGWVDV